MDWRDDICTCASSTCSHKEECVRATQYHKPGIHTVSDFTRLCKNDGKYEYFIKEDKQ